jgi:biopolymer transport protein ExbD
VKILRAALLAFASALALHAQEIRALSDQDTGILPNPVDPAHLLPHDTLIRVFWSEADHTGSLEMDQRKFTKLADILDPLRAKVAADAELRIVVWPVAHVPIEFAREVAGVLRQAGVTRAAVAMPEEPVTLPPAKDPKATPVPGSQLVVRVTWSATTDTGDIEIEGKKFAKADEILETLQAWAKAKPDARILIRADRAVHYDYLKQVMVVAGKAGIGKVTFSVVDKDPPTPVQ